MVTTSYELTYKRHNPEAVRLTIQKAHRTPDVFLMRCEADARKLVDVCHYNNMLVERL